MAKKKAETFNEDFTVGYVVEQAEWERVLSELSKN